MVPTKADPVILSATKDLGSEASRCPSRQTLRFAQGDKPFPMVVVNIHYRPPTVRVVAYNVMYVSTGEDDEKKEETYVHCHIRISQTT